ncbi:MAG: hypothetical protein ITG07_15075 [Candidimonas sp.]|nr:hypothetical protein [Candidimonas sp.]
MGHYKNTKNAELLRRAHQAIWESWQETCHLNRNHPKAAVQTGKAAGFYDPFAGVEI